MFDDDIPDYSKVREIPWEEPGVPTPEQRLRREFKNIHAELSRIGREVDDLRRQLQEHLDTDEDA